MLVTNLIGSFWQIANWVIDHFITMQDLLYYLRNIGTPVTTLQNTVLPVLYFIIPKSDIRPIFHLAFYFGTVRIAMAIVNLIWW